MVYDYDPPRSDVFGFFVFTLVAGIVGLTITKDGEFRKKLVYQHLTSTCLALAVYIFPAIICLRVAVSEASQGPSHPRKLLFVECGSGLGLLALTSVCGCVKFGSSLTRKLGLTDLHELINQDTYEKSIKDYQNAVREYERAKSESWEARKVYEEGVKEYESARTNYEKPRKEYDRARNEYNRTKAEFEKAAKERTRRIPFPTPKRYLCRNRMLWWFAMTYFFFRFLFLYLIYIPFCIGTNLYIASFNLPKIGFNEIIFFVFFGIVIVYVTFWFFWTICFFQAYIHLVLILNSFIICYFVADTSYLANLLLGSLAIYLSTTYDMVNDHDVPKIYQIPTCWVFQIKAWWSDKPGELVSPWEKHSGRAGEAAPTAVDESVEQHSKRSNAEDETEGLSRQQTKLVKQISRQVYHEEFGDRGRGSGSVRSWTPPEPVPERLIRQPLGAGPRGLTGDYVWHEVAKSGESGGGMKGRDKGGRGGGM